MRYLVHTIRKEDVGKPVLHLEGRPVLVMHLIGHIMDMDVGKRIYNVDGIYQTENDEQLRARLEKERQQ